MSLEPKNEGARKASIHRTWGRFYSTVSQYRGDDLEPVKAILRKAILRRYPKKVGSIVLDRRVNVPEVHTLESAAKSAGVSPRTLRQLCQNEPTLQALDIDLSQAGAITTGVLLQIKDVASRMMREKEVSTYLGIKYSHFYRFRQYQLIEKFPGVERYYDKAKIDALVSALRNSADTTTSPPIGAWSFVDAISSGLSIRKAINFVLEKRLSRVWYVEGEIGLKSIWFDKLESKKKLHSSAPP